MRKHVSKLFMKSFFTERQSAKVATIIATSNGLFHML
jgi:hypothetical protein